MGEGEREEEREATHLSAIFIHFNFYLFKLMT